MSLFLVPFPPATPTAHARVVQYVFHDVAPLCAFVPFHWVDIVLQLLKAEATPLLQ
jgi:hypothetical protein